MIHYRTTNFASRLKSLKFWKFAQGICFCKTEVETEKKSTQLSDEI